MGTTTTKAAGPETARRGSWEARVRFMVDGDEANGGSPISSTFDVGARAGGSLHRHAREDE